VRPKRLTKGMYLMFLLDGEWELAKLYNKPCNMGEDWRYVIHSMNEFGVRSFPMDAIWMSDNRWLLLKRSA
jgi:hypothetical protein